MVSSIRLGDYIKLVDERNKNLEVKQLLGISNEKKFIPSIANIIGTDLSSYKVVSKNQFAFGTVTSRNGDKISIAKYNGEEKAIISSSYVVFEVTDNNVIDNDYLFLWFNRPEFDRYCRYHSTGSTREIFSFEDMSNIEMTIPSIDEQKKIVEFFNKIDNIQICIQSISDSLYELNSNAFNLYSKKFSEQRKVSEFLNIFTGKKNANENSLDGEYLFFSCSPEPLLSKTYIYDGPAVIIAGNGAYTARTQFYDGKFELYQRTYACVLNENIDNDYIYGLYVIMKEKFEKKYLGGTHGSAIPYIVIGDIADFEIPFDNDVFGEFSNVVKKNVITIQKINEISNELLQYEKQLLPMLMSCKYSINDLLRG